MTGGSAIITKCSRSSAASKWRASRRPIASWRSDDPESGDQDRAHGPREALRLRAARRLPDHRGLPARPALRAAPDLPGEPVPVVAGDREPPRRQASPAAGRTSFASSSCCPAGRTTEQDDTRGQLALLADADGDQERFLATTIRARSGNTSDRVYVHAKVGIVDDRWLTLGSANLNAHSFFNDSEVNVVTCDAGARARHASTTVGRPSRTRHRRGRRRSEHRRRRALASDRGRAARAQGPRGTVTHGAGGAAGDLA